MTLFLSIGAIEQALEGTALLQLKTFSKPITSVTRLDMTVLTKQCEIQLGRQRGRALMKRMLDELARAKMLGEILPCAATQFRLPRQRLTLSEFRRLLLKFNHNERRLIVVALAAEKSLVECALFQHKEIKKIANINKWTSELRRFVEMCPTHIRCPYVFWDIAHDGQPVAMVGLDAKFRKTAKASWSTFASLCSDLIPIDSEQDAKEFATMFVLESANIG